jgi:hypothetical protein
VTSPHVLHSNGPWADTKKTLPPHCWPCVCCRHCLGMDLHVTILNVLICFSMLSNLFLYMSCAKIQSVDKN